VGSGDSQKKLESLRSALQSGSRNLMVTRRELLRTMVALAAGGTSWTALFAERSKYSGVAGLRGGHLPQVHLSSTQDHLLDEIERATSLFFWEQADSATGLVKDRARADGDDDHHIASTAATGFGLTGLCIAVQRAYLEAAQVKERVRHTLQFLWESFVHEHGFFYHFVNFKTGEREFRSEVSSIDTTILLCGVLTCRQFFDDPDIRMLAQKIYERVDWPWLLNDGATTLSHGWKPETGFLKPHWAIYSEHMMIELLAMGSPTHPVPASVWGAFERPRYHYYGQDYIGCKAPLFVHQYSQAWFDFRQRHDRYADYFENSVRATKAHRGFCIELKKRFPDYGPDMWGITSSDSAHGYTAWGGPPEMGKIDGSLVPAAAAGSLPFLPKECLRVLQNMRERFGTNIWKRYGFVDAFNPLTDWVDQDVVGIDTGITLLMAENARSGFVWETFMKNPEARAGMEKAGFDLSR
jgi:hypothetical protein